MHEPTRVHWSGVLRILAYVNGTLGKGLVYRSGHLRVEAYSDSGFAGDRGDRKSHIGLLYICGR